jgi:hypothetical protein
MTLPLGRANTSQSGSHPSHTGSYDPFENILSGSAGPPPLSQSSASLSLNAHLTPAAQSSRSPRSGFLFPEPRDEPSERTSLNSSAMNTPLPSRSPSPLPPFYSSAPSSASDTDSDEPRSPFILDTYGTPYLREGRPTWWRPRQRSFRGPRQPVGWGYRSMLRVLRRVFRHRFFPKHPSTIVRPPHICLSRLPHARSPLKCFQTDTLSSFFLPISAVDNFSLDPFIKSRQGASTMAGLLHNARDVDGPPAA